VTLFEWLLKLLRDANCFGARTRILARGVDFNVRRMETVLALMHPKEWANGMEGVRGGMSYLDTVVDLAYCVANGAIARMDIK
jgi:hypothetical protein